MHEQICLMSTTARCQTELKLTILTIFLAAEDNKVKLAASVLVLVSPTSSLSSSLTSFDIFKFLEKTSIRITNISRKKLSEKYQQSDCSKKFEVVKYSSEAETWSCD
ncbi:hypothetical protein L3X38_041655 [Prunus dulcis]|uniref:Uncharacterized protein n=1 Tax=Prunus dulcis TaxID=3755 RepID=A0AAD4UVC2_PRUDU|nr:hypothetical protein L3X38_041655 [Prunus dulcis]